MQREARLAVKEHQTERKQFRIIAPVAISPSHQPVKEGPVYAAIRQGKAKTGMAGELTRRIKEGAIPIISDVPGFMAYYVVYAPDDTVTAISIRLRRSRRVKQACARVDRAESCAPAYRGSHGVGRAGDRAHLGVATNSWVWEIVHHPRLRGVARQCAVPVRLAGRAPRAATPPLHRSLMNSRRCIYPSRGLRQGFKAST